jgi:hypothetical protein
MRDPILRIGLAVLAIPSVIIGIWAGLTPRSFYDDFPGLGQVWVAPTGRYSEHLVRDVGELNLALALITIVAAITLGPLLVRTVLAGWLVYSVPHLVYHLRHLQPFGTDDKVSMIASLAFVPVLAVALLVISVRVPRPTDRVPVAVGD